jgi:hypothetical protein
VDLFGVLMMVVLLNLVIAQFTTTYEAIQSHVRAHLRRQRPSTLI